MAEEKQRPSRHICLTRRAPMGISTDPELDMLTALADPDVLNLTRGLAKKEVRSPFPDGLFGMDAARTNAAIRRMRDAGLISSRRDGNDHVYFLNVPRFRELAQNRNLRRPDQDFFLGAEVLVGFTFPGLVQSNWR